jgi:hypothetical protein
MAKMNSPLADAYCYVDLVRMFHRRTEEFFDALDSLAELKRKCEARRAKMSIDDGEEHPFHEQDDIERNRLRIDSLRLAQRNLRGEIEQLKKQRDALYAAALDARKAISTQPDSAGLMSPEEMDALRSLDTAIQLAEGK